MLLFSSQLCELLPLSPSLWFNSLPLPRSMWISILYTRILLDTRVFKSSQTWTRALRVDCTTQIKLLASRQFTRPKSVHATTLENDRCKKGLNIYFSLNAHKLGATWSYHRLKTTTQLTWLIPLRTPNSDRNEAQHSGVTILISRARYCSQLSHWIQHSRWYQHSRCWKMEKTGDQHKPHNDNIQQ